MARCVTGRLGANSAGSERRDPVAVCGACCNLLPPLPSTKPPLDDNNCDVKMTADVWSLYPP